MIRIRKKRFFKIARVVTMFIIGLCVAFFIALSRVNLETLRSDIVAGLQDSTGLPVEIAGDISWKLSLRPKIVLNKVSIKNADFAKHKNGFYAKKIDVTVNLFSLLQDRPSIEKVKIYNGTVFIEKNEKNEYSIKPKSFVSEEKLKDVAEEKNIKKIFPFELDFGLESIDLHNFSLNIEQSSYFVSDLHIKYKTNKNSKEYTGWLKSKAKFYPFVVSFSKFNEERKIYPVRVALSTGGPALVANIALEGTSKMPIDFLISGNLDNISEIGSVFGLGLPRMSGVKLDIAGGLGHKNLKFKKFNLFSADSDLKLAGNLDWSGKITKINFSGKSSKLNFSKIFPKKYKIASSVWVRPNRELNVFKDTPLFGELFHKFNLNLKLDLKDLDVYKDLNLKDVHINSILKDSKMNMDITTNIAGGDLRLATDIKSDENNILNLKISAMAERVYVGEIINQVGYKNFLSALPVNFEFYWRGRGTNLSELMSSITGPFYLYSVGPGYAHADLVSNMYGADFLTDIRHNLQDLVSSEKKYDQITISCAAINIKFRNGKMETKNGIAIETNAINTRLVGNADLGAETLKASMITVPVRGLKFSLTGNFVNSIEFKGNMAEPDIKINTAAIAGKVASATGIGLLIAPFTGGLSLVGAGVGFLAGDLLENWLADDHPCKTAMEKGAPEKDGDPDWLNKPMSDLVGELLK